MLTFARFVWILTRPLLGTLAIPLLLVGWLVLSLVLGVMGAWEQAAGRGDEWERKMAKVDL